MDRPIIYSQEQGRTFDVLNGWKDTLKGIGNLAQGMMGGGTTTVCSGLGCTAQGSPNMSVNLAAGQIYQLTAIDTTAWGALASDASTIIQQGTAAAQTVTLSTGGLLSGQSQWVLIQATFSQADIVRSGDPSGSGVLPYYNSALPSSPLQGPGGGGASQNTERTATCSISLNYGTPATTGSQTAPSASANNVGLYLILLTFGQTTITQGQILTAGPSVGTGVSGGYPQAPFLAGLLNSHHNGLAGQAPQIKLTSEVQGVLPVANTPYTGNLVVSGTVSALPTIRVGAGSPNGTITGNIGDLWFDNVGLNIYVCTVTAGTTWIEASASPPGVQTTYVTSWGSALVPSAGLQNYICNTASGTVWNVNLGTAASMLSPTSSELFFLNLGPNPININPNASEQIQGNGNGVAYILMPNDGLTIIPRSSYGWYIK